MRFGALAQTGTVALSLALSGGQRAAAVGKTSFVFDGNRIYAELGFIRQDGGVHRALAFVDMGSPVMTVRESLFRELHLDQNRPLRFRVGELTVDVPSADVQPEPRAPSSIGSDLRVEAMLPASILQRYVVVIDYQNRTLMLAKPGPVTREGVAVPFRINPKTGLIAVDALIDDKPYSIAIDNGSAYTWVRQNAANGWTSKHPGWERGVGAVGASNMMMSGDTTETSGTLVRIPEISVGSLILRDVGLLAAGPGRLIPGNVDLFDWYSQKNSGSVIGWIGGNVLKGFRLTIDYPNRTIYWLPQTGPDAHDLDQVGLTLRSENGTFVVAAIATKNGQPTVQGIAPGDKLIRVGELELSRATWGEVFHAMHGAPGEMRALIVERGGMRRAVTATVTAF